MIVLLLLPSTCTVCTVSVSLVTLTTYPSASDESSAVQLTVIVVSVLLSEIPVGADEGTKIKEFVISRTRFYLPCIVTSSLLIGSLVTSTTH